MYTGQVTFYKVPEKYGHVYLVWFYFKSLGRSIENYMYINVYIFNFGLTVI